MRFKRTYVTRQDEDEIMWIYPATATAIHTHHFTSPIDCQFWCVRLESNPIWILQYISDETNWVGVKFNEISKESYVTRQAEDKIMWIHPATTKQLFMPITLSRRTNLPLKSIVSFDVRDSSRIPSESYKFYVMRQVKLGLS
jgi:hypothetical protein